MDEYLASLGRRRKAIAADGACLFRCFAFALLHTEACHMALRRLAIEHMQRHRSEFEPFMDQPWETYMLEMSSPRTWGTHLELKALSAALGVSVVLFAAQPQPHAMQTFTQPTTGTATPTLLPPFPATLRQPQPEQQSQRNEESAQSEKQDQQTLTQEQRENRDTEQRKQRQMKTRRTAQGEHEQEPATVKEGQEGQEEEGLQHHGREENQQQQQQQQRRQVQKTAEQRRVIELCYWNSNHYDLVYSDTFFHHAGIVYDILRGVVQKAINVQLEQDKPFSHTHTPPPAANRPLAPGDPCAVRLADDGVEAGNKQRELTHATVRKANGSSVTVELKDGTLHDVPSNAVVRLERDLPASVRVYRKGDDDEDERYSLAQPKKQKHKGKKKKSKQRKKKQILLQL